MYSNLNYIKRSKRMKAKAKATLGYIGTRPGRDGEKLVRELFGRFGTYTPEEVTRMIEEAPDTTLFWRFKFNPDPTVENPEKRIDLRELTRDAIAWLEERLATEGKPRELPFVAAIHDDHTDLAHVHGIFLMERVGRERPITKDVINEFRAHVARLALAQQRQREQTQGLAVALGLQDRGPATQQAAAISLSSPQASVSEALPGSSEGGGGGGGDLGQIATDCPNCFVGTLSKRLNSRVYECNECGFAMRHGLVIRPGRRKERDYARSY